MKFINYNLKKAETWNFAILEFWNFEFWFSKLDLGILEFWILSFTMLEFRIFKFAHFGIWNFGILIFQVSRFPGSCDLPIFFSFFFSPARLFPPASLLAAKKTVTQRKVDQLVLNVTSKNDTFLTNLPTLTRLFLPKFRVWHHPFCRTKIACQMRASVQSGRNFVVRWILIPWP